MPPRRAIETILRFCCSITLVVAVYRDSVQVQWASILTHWGFFFLHLFYTCIIWGGEGECPSVSYLWLFVVLNFFPNFPTWFKSLSYISVVGVSTLASCFRTSPAMCSSAFLLLREFVSWVVRIMSTIYLGSILPYPFPWFRF